MVGALLWSALAWGGEVDPALLHRRLEEIAPLRAQRLAKDGPVAPAEAYDKAAAGEVVTTLDSVAGHAAKKVLAVSVLDVPIGRLWAAVNDESSKVASTKLSYLEMVEGKNCENGRVVLQYLPVSLVTDRWWVVQQSMNDELQNASGGRVREVRWAGVDQRPTTETGKAWMAKGMSLAYTHGAWFLVDLDGANTLVEYYTWSDPGGRVPAGLASTFAAGSIEDTLVTMGELAKKGPNCPIN
jgi:hypothetical protein